MAQRDYEEQPEAPDLGASVQLESELHLGAPPGDRDALDAGDPLAERAMADAARDGGADGATPDLPQDPADAGPATPELGDAAARIDASRGSDGAVAPASGRQDVGPEVWR